MPLNKHCAYNEYIECFDKINYQILMLNIWKQKNKKREKRKKRDRGACLLLLEFQNKYYCWCSEHTHKKSSVTITTGHKTRNLFFCELLSVTVFFSFFFVVVSYMTLSYRNVLKWYEHLLKLTIQFGFFFLCFAIGLTHMIVVEIYKRLLLEIEEFQLEKISCFGLENLIRFPLNDKDFYTYFKAKNHILYQLKYVWFELFQPHKQNKKRKEMLAFAFINLMNTMRYILILLVFIVSNRILIPH